MVQGALLVVLAVACLTLMLLTLCNKGELPDLIELDDFRGRQRFVNTPFVAVIRDVKTVGRRVHM